MGSLTRGCGLNEWAKLLAMNLIRIAFLGTTIFYDLTTVE